MDCDKKNPSNISLIKKKARILDSMDIEVMPGLKDMNTEERISYAETFLGLEFPIHGMSIRNQLLGLQEETFTYVCGHCGVKVAGIIASKYARDDVFWLACTNCVRGSVSNFGTITPPPLLGEDVEGLPDKIQSAYMEARKSFSHECYVACELMCRKILMNVAVEKGAVEGDGFAQYVDYMSKEGHITKSMRQWVVQIKNNGNESTHKINPPNLERTKTTLTFTSLLLKNVYETAYLMGSKPK